MALTLSESGHASKSKAELVEEIFPLNNELRTKNEEIAILKKKLVLYRYIKQKIKGK